MEKFKLVIIHLNGTVSSYEYNDYKIYKKECTWYQNNKNVLNVTSLFFNKDKNIYFMKEDIIKNEK